MSNATIFYIFGIALAVSAVLVSIVGLKVKSFPGKAFPLVIVWFAVLVVGSATFAVKHEQEEEKDHAAVYKQAGEEAEADAADTLKAAPSEAKEEAAAGEAESEPVGESEAEGGGGEEAAAKGPGGTLQLKASENELAFNTKTLTSKPGKVTIDFENPSMLEHDVAIDKDGKQIAVSEVVSDGKTSVTADLPPGTYTFLCTIPGHAEAGMEGMLTVK